MIKDEGTAWDVAWAAVYLASEEVRWVTAQVLLVDAGISAAMAGGGAQAGGDGTAKDTADETGKALGYSPLVDIVFRK